MAISFSLTPDKTTPGPFSHSEFNALIIALTDTAAAYPMASIPTPASLGLFPNKSIGQKMASAEYNNIVTILGQIVSVANGGGTPVSSKATAPSFGTINDVADTVPLSSPYSYDQVRWGIEGQGAQTLGSNSICAPGNITGRLFAYVVADPASYRLQSDTVYSQPFTVAAAANTNPTATIALANGSSTNISAGQSVTFQLSGADSDAGDSVVKLELYDNGAKIAGAEIAGASGALTATNVTAGTHNYTAWATDSKGGRGQSSSAIVVTAAATGTPTEEQFKVTGDSLEGHNETEADPEAGYYSPLRYSILARNAMPTGYYGDWGAQGRSGYTLDQLKAIESTVLGGRNASKWAKGTMGLGGGINNFLYTSDTAQQVFDKKVDQIQAAFNYGWTQVVVFTLTRAYAGSQDRAAVYARIAAYNELLRAYVAANPANIILVDFAKDQQLNDPEDINTGGVHHLGDPIHFAEPGEILKGRMLKNSLLARRSGIATPVGQTPVLGTYDPTSKTIPITSIYAASALLLSINGGVYKPLTRKTITTDGASHPEGYYKVIAGTTSTYNCSAVATSAAIAVTPPPVTTKTYGVDDFTTAAGSWGVNGRDIGKPIAYTTDTNGEKYIDLPANTSHVKLSHQYYSSFYTRYLVLYQGSPIGTVDEVAYGSTPAEKTTKLDVDVPTGGGRLQVIAQAVGGGYSQIAFVEELIATLQ